jgi:hypothetical protein
MPRRLAYTIVHNSLRLPIALAKLLEFGIFFTGHFPIHVQCKTKGCRSGVRLIAQLEIRCLIVDYCMRWRCKFKGLSQDGGRADFM